jgi:hypothetical protein
MHKNIAENNDRTIPSERAIYLLYLSSSPNILSDLENA